MKECVCEVLLKAESHRDLLGEVKGMRVRRPKGGRGKGREKRPKEVVAEVFMEGIFTMAFLGVFWGRKERPESELQVPGVCALALEARDEGLDVHVS